MDFYLAGVAVAFLIGVLMFGVAVRYRYSIRAKNLKKIGLSYRVSSGRFEPEGTTKAGWVAYFVWLLVFAPLGSWLSVVSAGWFLVAAARKRAQLPQAAKDLHELVGRRELTAQEWVEAQEAAQRELGQPGAALTGADEGDPTFLVLEDGEDFYSTVEVDPSGKLLTFTDRSGDCHDWFHSIEEYRFVGEEVQTRLIEDYSESMGKKEWSVKDGVVLESELLKRYEAMPPIELSIMGTAEEKIAQLKKRVEWQPVKRDTLRFFVMSQHPTEFPLRDRRRLIRTELERIEAAARKLLELAKAHGFEPHETETGTDLAFPESLTDADKRRIRDGFMKDERVGATGMHPAELAHIKEARRDLLKLLGEAAAA